ncbi:protein regulator of cytokinesis 1-like isoform X2 [Antedon mediterranea]|uniref:protein regulator of cytokinesis 1-like isoform X2 n=1 Tax=Antedon mediterranea TaxID=105859 RepID=UPI003AF7724A
MMAENKRESMKLEIGSCLDAALSQLTHIWNEIGICEEQRQERQTVVMHHLRNLLQEMVDEEQEMSNRLKQSVDKCQCELKTLVQELGEEHVKPDEGLTILQLEKLLRSQVDSLSKVKQQRLDYLKSLKETEQALCDALCVTPHYIPTGIVPTQKDLDKLKEHIESLTSEKANRQSIFSSTKKEIVSLFENLEQGPNTSFEREVLCEEEDTFQLSLANLEALKQLRNDLEITEKENEILAHELYDKIKSLWKRLRVDEAEKEDFQMTHQGHRPKTIQILKEELQRLNELKKQNLKKVIEEMREELTSWWNKCFFSLEQRQTFTAASDDEFTEELLELHDLEVAKMKAYYEENEEILECIKKREDMWKKMLEFERNANDPSRFFSRGCNLLQEEKTRKKINKELPKLEQKLSERIARYEEEKDKAFLVDGCRFMDYVQAQWVAHEQEKLIQKEMRMKNKQKQTQEEMTFGSKPSTPSAKRRFMGTPNKTPSKKLRGMNGTVAPSPKSFVSSTLMPSPSPLRRPPRGNTTSNTKGVRNKTSQSGHKSTVHIPFPSPGTRSSRYGQSATTTPNRLRNPARVQRRALMDKNTQDTVLSATTLSGGSIHAHANLSIASTCSSYSDFTRGLKEGNKPYANSSIITSPAKLKISTKTLNV